MTNEKLKELQGKVESYFTLAAYTISGLFILAVLIKTFIKYIS